MEEWFSHVFPLSIVKPTANSGKGDRTGGKKGCYIMLYILNYIYITSIYRGNWESLGKLNSMVLRILRRLTFRYRMVPLACDPHSLLETHDCFQGLPLGRQKIRRTCWKDTMSLPLLLVVTLTIRSYISYSHTWPLGRIFIYLFGETCCYSYKECKWHVVDREGCIGTAWAHRQA